MIVTGLSLPTECLQQVLTNTTCDGPGEFSTPCSTCAGYAGENCLDWCGLKVLETAQERYAVLANMRSSRRRSMRDLQFYERLRLVVQ